MIQTFKDNNGKQWQYTGEYRIAGPFEYYLDPYASHSEYIVTHAGEWKTKNKVLIVTPLHTIATKTWSNH